MAEIRSFRRCLMDSKDEGVFRIQPQDSVSLPGLFGLILCQENHRHAETVGYSAVISGVLIAGSENGRMQSSRPDGLPGRGM